MVYREQLEHVELDHCETFCLAVSGNRYLDVHEELREQRQKNDRPSGGMEKKIQTDDIVNNHSVYV